MNTNYDNALMAKGEVVKQKDEVKKQNELLGEKLNVLKKLKEKAKEEINWILSDEDE